MRGGGADDGPGVSVSVFVFVLLMMPFVVSGGVVEVMVVFGFFVVLGIVVVVVAVATAAVAAVAVAVVARPHSSFPPVVSVPPPLFPAVSMDFSSRYFRIANDVSVFAANSPESGKLTFAVGPRMRRAASS